jgi:hypothetical protein
VVDAKLAHRASDRLRISEVPSGNPFDTANNLQTGAQIVQSGKPVGEVGCFANLDHPEYVIYGLHQCK